MKKVSPFILVIVLCALLLTWCKHSSPQIKSSDLPSDSVLIDLIHPSLVQIGTTQIQYIPGEISQTNAENINRRGRGIAVGSWQIATAAHLFNDAEWIYVARLSDETIIPITNVRKKENDLAIAWVSNSLITYKSISNEKFPKKWEIVFTVIDEEIIKWQLLKFGKNEIVSTLLLEPWMSGSPLFTQVWVLIGINTAISNEEDNRTFSQFLPTPFSTTYLTWDTWILD